MCHWGQLRINCHGRTASYNGDTSTVTSSASPLALPVNPVSLSSRFPDDMKLTIAANDQTYLLEAKQ